MSAVPERRASCVSGLAAWLGSFLGWLFLTQIALLILILLVIAVVAAASRGDRDSTPGPAGLLGRALAGLGAPVMLLLSWVLAVSFAAGLVLRSAGSFLGTPVPVNRPAAGPAVLFVPGVYYWAAACALCLVAVTGLVAVLVFIRVWSHTRKREKPLVNGAEVVPWGRNVR